MLILKLLEPEVMAWLGQRHMLQVAPQLVHDRAAFLDAIGHVRALIVPPSVRVDARALLHAPLLRAVGRVCDSAENIDVDSCQRAGVEVVRAGAATAQAEAEFIVNALLTLLRRVPVKDRDGSRAGRELGASTVGLIGMGPAARSTAKLLKAFGSRLVGYEPAVHASVGVWERWGVQPLSLPQLLAQSDAVCVQLGSYSRYRRLLGERLLPLCKPNQVIVSTAHADVFDEAVLADALRSGRVAAAWLDSVRPGALDVGRPLAGIANLQVTPQLASSTVEARRRSAWSVARRIDALLSGTTAVAANRPEATPAMASAPAPEPAMKLMAAVAA